MIKKFHIFENSLFTDLNDNKEDEEKLVQIMGFDKKDCLLTLHNYWYLDFTLSFKQKYLINFFNLEDGILKWCINVLSPYYGYESNADNSEIDFIDGYLDSDNLEKLELLLKYLDIGIDYQRTWAVFEVLGEVQIDDKSIDIDNFTNEISVEWTNAVKQNIKESLNELPFKITSSSFTNFEIDLEFSIEKIGEYIEKNKLDVKTIKEFLENIDVANYINYNYLENHYETNYDFDWSDLNKVFKKYIDNILDKIDLKINFDDPNQLKLFNDDEYSKMINKKYNFDNELFRNIGIDKLNDAKRAGGKLLAWFKSYPFQKEYMKDPSVEKYNKLKKEKILHPDIEEEYEYLDAASKYNF